MVTLDLIPRSEAEQRHWIAEHSGVYPAIVATMNGKVCGFASLSPYRARAGYSTTVEDSIYVDSEYRKQGVGTALLNHILTLANQHGFHACIHLCLIVAGAIFGEQKLQDERRNVSAFLDPMQQVLTKNLAVERGV